MAIPAIMRSATAAKETEITHISDNISKYSAADNAEIFNLNMQLTTANQLSLPLEIREEIQEKIRKASLHYTQTMNSVIQRVEALQQEILLIPTRQTEMAEFILNTLGCPASLLTVIDEYVEETNN